MFPAFSSLTGGGGLSASGGDATSGNGDTAFSNKSKFGGLNYKTGINPTMLIVGLIVAFLVFKYA